VVALATRYVDDPGVAAVVRERHQPGRNPGGVLRPGSGGLSRWARLYGSRAARDISVPGSVGGVM
jgi:hypothetical protein